MANNYESLKTDGHYTMARRIFTKIKSWVENKVKTDVPANAKFTDTNTHRPIQVNGTTILGLTNTTALNLVPGNNVSMTHSGGSVTVSADQIDDTYDYDDYQDLPDSIKMQDKIFMVSGAPKPVYFRYIEETETIIFTNGYAHYNAETESISLGG